MPGNLGGENVSLSAYGTNMSSVFSMKGSIASLAMCHGAGNVFRFSFQANLLTLINDHGYFAEEKGADMSSGGSRLDWNKHSVSCREKL